MSLPGSQMARPIFAKIAPHEYLVASLSHEGGMRPNGRFLLQARPFDFHMGSLSQTHGSAVMRLGQTCVICGVRGEILPVANIPQYRPSSELSMDRSPDTSASAEADNRRQLREYDLLVPNLELATGCSPDYLPGGPPSELAQSLSTRLYALLHSSGLVDADQLKIWHIPPPPPPTQTDDADMDADERDEIEQAVPELKAYWTLYIDLLFLSLDGNPFDTAWAAIVAALSDTRLPSVSWDADRDVAVAVATGSTPSSATAQQQPPPSPPQQQQQEQQNPRPRLVVRGLPLATTAVVCVRNKKKHKSSGGVSDGRWILVDPDRLEESQCRETITIVVDRVSAKNGDTSMVVRSLYKNGGVLASPKDVCSLMTIAEQRWATFSAALRARQ